MKNLSTVLLAGFLLSACSSAPKPELSQCIVDTVNAPTWVCQPDHADLLVSVGSAPHSAIGMNFTRTEALSDARAGLSRNIEVLVKSKVEQFARSTGIASNEVADKVSTQVSKNVSKTTLYGSKQVAYFDSGKNLFVLVGVPKENVGKATKVDIASSFANKDAHWQQFLSEEALNKLESEF